MKQLWLRINWRLLLTIMLWVLAALLIYTIAGWIQSDGKQALFSWKRILINWHGSDPEKIKDASLKLVGGIGAITYLVIRYRERSDAERSDAESKLAAAVQQLGDKYSPTRRIAGVYALIEVSNRYGTEYHQRVVDVLCGYLRSERGHWEDENGTIVSIADPSERDDKFYISVDGAVESTIVGALKENCKKDEMWSECRLDLHNACFVDRVDFRRLCCKGIHARDAFFNQGVLLSNALIDGHLNMSRTIFKNEGVDFSRSIITKICKFNGADFNDCVFKKTQFRGKFDFKNANFPKSLQKKFEGAKFNKAYEAEAKDVDNKFVSLPKIDGLPEGELPPGAEWKDFGRLSHSNSSGIE